MKILKIVWAWLRWVFTGRSLEADTDNWVQQGLHVVRGLLPYRTEKKEEPIVPEKYS